MFDPNLVLNINFFRTEGVRVNLKGNAKYVYHRKLSMFTCTYTKEPRHTLQFPQLQVYLYAFI
jgi:hypothetical protein